MLKFWKNGELVNGPLPVKQLEYLETNVNNPSWNECCTLKTTAPQLMVMVEVLLWISSHDENMPSLATETTCMFIER